MKIILLLIFWCLWFLNFSTRAIVSPVLPIVEQELGISHTAAGGIFTFMSVGFTAAVLLAGYLTQRIGFKKSLLLSFFIISAALLLMQYAATYMAISLICVFIGFGAGMYLPSAVPLLTETFGRRHWGKAISVHDSGANFSIISVPILTALALQVFHWRTLFLILGILCVFFTLILAKTCPDVAVDVRERGRFRSLVPRRDFWLVTLYWTLATATSLSVYNILPLFLINERGITLETANTVLGLSRGGGLFAGLIAGFLTDRYGVKKILIFLIGGVGIFTVMLAFVRIFPLLVAILLLQATFAPAFFPIGFVAVSKLTTIQERSIFMASTIAFGAAVGFGLTTQMLGLIADLRDFQTGIALLGGLVILSCLLLRGFPKI